MFWVLFPSRFGHCLSFEIVQNPKASASDLKAEILEEAKDKGLLIGKVRRVLT